MYPSSSTQQPAAICALKSPADAIHILEAVRLGLVPRVTRRLTGHERSMIRPGTIWVWEEEETNMRRWTDGRRWGASRVGGGGFLVYTESSDNLSPPPSRERPGNEYMSRPPHGAPGYQPYTGRASRPESLIKQTYSTSMTHPVTGKTKKFHVVAYSSKHNPQGDANNPLPLPHQLPLLATLKITPGIWPEWEHRRDADYNARRAASYPPVPPGSQSAPVTAVASPDDPEGYNRGRSPSHHGQPRMSPAMPQSAVPPYQASPYASPAERYHPYHDPSRQHRAYPPQAPAPVSAASSSSMPIPSTPDSYYDGDRRYQQAPPRLSPQQQQHSYQAYPYDPYGRDYMRRDGYYVEFALPPHQPEAIGRSPEDKLRSDDISHIRHHSAPIPTPTTHLVPPPGDTSGGKSPKMSIGNSLLNPSANAQSTSLSPISANGAGYKLPPLRVAVDQTSSQTIGNSSSNSNSSTNLLSPRVPSDSGNSPSSGSSKGEDERQLGELGKRVSL